MANIGIAPPDYNTPVGILRRRVGDTEYVETTPGFGDYTMFSDAELEGFLSDGGGSVSRALGYIFLEIAGNAALLAKYIKTDDLTLDTTKRAADLRAMAETWFDRADAEDEAEGLADEFVVVSTGQSGCRCYPELAAFPVCRCSCV